MTWLINGQPLHYWTQQLEFSADRDYWDKCILDDETNSTANFYTERLVLKDTTHPLLTETLKLQCVSMFGCQNANEKDCVASICFSNVTYVEGMGVYLALRE